MPKRPRIYITGDTHGDIDIHKLTAGRWPEGRKLSKDDVLIIAGDFGLVFSPKKDETERYWLDWLDECPWTTLFIDGNHENFDRLYKLPCEERYGGPVGVVRPSVLHLRRRGHVYTVASKRFWCFGGATSIDKKYRTEGRSWWHQEEPTREQMEYGMSQIEKYGGKFDYIVTHDCPSRVLYSCWDKFELHNSIDKITPGPVGRYLEQVVDMVNVKCWYFGHYHTDCSYECETDAGNIRFMALCKDIVRVNLRKVFLVLQYLVYKNIAPNP